MRRTQLLARVPIAADSALELFDSFQMGSQCALAAGDLGAARRLGRGLLELPFYREEYHLATSRLIVVGLIEGTWDEALGQAERFRSGWERAGRPLQGNLRTAPYAAATIQALRGDDAAGAEWKAVAATLEAPVRLDPTPGRLGGDPAAPFGRFFDALVLLHRGLAAEALELLSDPPESLVGDAGGLWRAWYASAWAEAAVLAEVGDVGDRLQRAASAAAGNPIAHAWSGAPRGWPGSGRTARPWPRRPRRGGVRAAGVGCGLPVGPHAGHARRAGPRPGTHRARPHGGGADGLAAGGAGPLTRSGPC